MEHVTYRSFPPAPQLREFVHSYWTMRVDSPATVPMIVLPDGYFDILYSLQPGNKFRTQLIGLSTKPQTYQVKPGSLSFAVSFKLPAAELLLQREVADLLDNATNIEFCPGISAKILHKPKSCVNLLNKDLSGRVPKSPDSKKMNLFREIYKSSGDVQVTKLAREVFWPAREINRYFNKWFGISLKKYLSILRYRSTFHQLRNSDLHPDLNFFDQSHFVREIKKYTGASPRILAQNENDRFIQLSTLPPE